tara:strand:- start:1046 stop:1759 length:714 start_codon:yes stop_codon:yes gene_type:complete
MQLINGECLEEMKNLPDSSVDIIVADLPYGRFKHLEWDKPIDLEKLWKQIWRVCKPRTPVFLFGDMLFGVKLINSQPKYFKYEIVWNKNKSTTPLLSKKRLGKATEYVFVFYKSQPVYNYEKYHKVLKREKPYFNGSVVGAEKVKKQTNYYLPHLPLNVFECPMMRKGKTISHITEKPQNLLEFLLKYFSNEDDVCLDMTMGSGSTGVASHNLKRKFIGIEVDTNHFNAAKQRIDNL